MLELLLSSSNRLPDDGTESWLCAPLTPQQLLTTADWHSQEESVGGKEKGDRTSDLSPCLPSDELRCDLIRLQKEAGLSYFLVVVAGVQIRRRFEGGACPSFYLARSGQKRRIGCLRMSDHSNTNRTKLDVCETFSYSYVQCDGLSLFEAQVQFWS